MACADDEMRPNTVVKSESETTISDSPLWRGDAVSFDCQNNYQDNAFNAEATSEHVGEDAVVDQEVDVVDCSGDAAVGLIKDDDSDATEHSSSFGDTCSGSDGDLYLDQGGVEVASGLGASSGDAAVSDRLGKVFERKKVTAHWRNFISPLTWRCQWLELRMKELLSKASNYDRELASLKNQKNMWFEMIKSDGSVSRSVPLSCQNTRKNVMKRRKRKRLEDILDASSYMSRHHIFSYYENESIEIGSHFVDADCDGQANESMKKRNSDVDWLLGSKDDVDWLALEQILLNLQSVQSRVLRLRSHLENLIFERAKESSFAVNLPVIYDENHTCSPSENGRTMSADSLPIPVLCSRDAAEQSIVESTVGLLFAAADPLASQHLQGFDKENSDDLLIDNHVAKDEYQNFEKVNNLQEQTQEFVEKEAKSPQEGQSFTPVAVDQDPIPEIEKAAVPCQVALSSCYSRKRKGQKPKGRRQGGSVQIQKQILMSQFAGKADDIPINKQPVDEKDQNSEKISHPVEQNQPLAEEEAGPQVEQERTAPLATNQKQSSEIGNSEVPPLALLKACNTRRRGGRKPKKRPLGDLNANDDLMDKLVAGKEHENSKRAHRPRKQPSRYADEESGFPPEAARSALAAAKQEAAQETESASAPPAVAKYYSSGRGRGGRRMAKNKRARGDVAAALNDRRSGSSSKLPYKRSRLSKQRS